MKRRVLGVVTAAALSLAAVVAVAGPAAAATTCQSGTVPAVSTSQSNLRMQCVILSADQSARVSLEDYPFARWHNGSARVVNGTITAAGVIVGATGTFNAGDVNHTVTTSTQNPCVKLPGGSFIKSFGAGAAATTTANLQLSLGTSPTPRTAPLNTSATRSVTSVTTVAGKSFAFATGAGTSVFAACDVGRTMTGGAGLPAGTKVTKFIDTKTVAISTVPAVSPAATRTLSSLSIPFQVNNSVARNVIDGAILNGSQTLTSLTAHFINAASTAGGDVGNFVTGECIPAGTTIDVWNSATSVHITNPSDCVEGNRIIHATTTITGTTLTAADGDFTPGDVNRKLAGTCVAASPANKIASVTNSTTVVLTQGAATTAAADSCAVTVQTGPNDQDLSISLPDNATSTARVVTDVTRPSAGHWHSDASPFLPTDVGQQILSGVTKFLITSVTSPTGGDAVTTTVGAGISAGPLSVTVGTPSGTAPINGDTVAQQATTLSLLSSLVAGSKPCSSGSLTGTTINGTWLNPGSFIASSGVLPKAQLGQIVFPTSVVSFSAFLTYRGASSTDETAHVNPQTLAHYEIVFPSEPVGAAVCPGTTVASDFSFNGTEAGQQSYPSGWGQPSSAVVRGITSVPTGTVAGDAFLITGGNDFIGTNCTIDSAITLSSLAAAFPCGT